jgi:hypothetical protein
VLSQTIADARVGHSEAPDAASAAGAAVRAALGAGTPAPGDIVVLFVSPRYDIEALYRAAVVAAAPATVVGCTSSGAFTHEAQIPCGCVASYLPAGDATFGVAHVPAVDGDVAASARHAAETARERAGERHPHSAVVVLADGLAGDQREVVRGAYEVTGAVIPLIGGTASDDFGYARTHQFGPAGVSTNGLVVVWINSPRPIGVGVGHGWRPVGEPMLVTRADGRLVQELDGRPAIEAYIETLGDRIDVEAKPFAAQVLRHPLGRATVDGRYEIAHAQDRLGDGLLTFAHLPEGALVQVMASDEVLLIEGARQAARDALACLDGPPAAALVFSCCARFELLGDARAAEAEGVSDALGGVPIAGFFTYGEFARIVGPSGFHNATVAVLAL